MHDFHLADQIVHLVLQHAQKHQLKKVKKILIELGGVVEHNEAVSPENLEFNIKLLAKGTILENSKIVIKKGRGNKWRLREIEGV